MAREATRQDYLQRSSTCVARLEQAIAGAVKLASPALQQVVNDLQALRGIRDISAVTHRERLGQVSRFDSARQLMGYCDAVPSEDSSGKRTRRGESRKLPTRTCDESSWKLHGAIVVHLVSGTDCADDRRLSPKRPKRLRGRHKVGCTSAIEN